MTEMSQRKGKPSLKLCSVESIYGQSVKYDSQYRQNLLILSSTQPKAVKTRSYVCKPVPNFF